ncbi:putative SWR1-complex protein 4 [Cladorrhinum sp. PSN332]|nr:putative SWR1-complex protein 4 [Cladorrhinum sp. PSN332]
MTSRDVHDVLNIPSDHSGVGRPSKKQKSNAIRPNLKGLAREVQNLSGDNPIAIVPEVSFFKKRRLASRKPATRWELKRFTNSARNDDGALVLRHWKRKTEDGPPADSESQPAENGTEGNAVAKVEKPEDSAFAKYNVHVQIPQYTDDQYHSNLQSSTWTKEETDYLLELAKDYDLRWAIIWDRYDFQPKEASGDSGNASTAIVPAGRPRTMEDLKARYYEISAKMMAVQTPVQYMTRPEFELYEMIQKFDPEQERKRKQFALNTMARNKDEAREEESLLLEVKRILARTERFNEERRELYNRLDYPATETDINSFKSSAGLQNLLQTLMTSDKAKKQRKQAMGPGDVASPSSAVPPSAVSETHPNRRESIAASAASAHRDSDARTPATPVEPTPTTANAANKKKGAPQPERRKLTQQEEQVYGVSYHDRLGSGPTFRYEKINKLYSHKSGQQQMRITNVLSELGIPPRLVMPTAQVTAQFELLWSAVTSLVDLRKVSDRLDGEIKVEEAKKAERDKAKGIVPPPAPTETNGIVDKEKSGGETNGEMEREKDGQQQNKEEKDEAETNGQTPKTGGDGEGAERGAAAENSKADSADVNGGDKQQDDVDGDKRPGSSGGASHKRSASVLSSVSDKSAKRQKK